MYCTCQSAAHDNREDERGVRVCDDLKKEMAALTRKNVHFSEVQEARWGSIVKIRLPGGGDLGLYQPKHPMALDKR